MGYRVVWALLALIEAFQSSYASKNQNIYLNQHSGSVDCFDAFRNCRKIPECFAALRNLNNKCKFANGRCSFESDVKKCEAVKDQLFMYGFPKERCRCERKYVRCFQLLNKVYANPCFENTRNIEFVHPSNNNMEKTSTTTEKITEIETTSENTNETLPSLGLKNGHITVAEATSPPSAGAESTSPKSTRSDKRHTRKTNHHNQHQLKENIIPVPTEEIVFGDEGFAEPPPRRKNATVFREFGKAESQNHHKSQNALSVSQTNKEIPQLLGDWSTEVVQNEEPTTTHSRQPLYLPKQNVEWEMTIDMKYRLISIVIGSAFVLVIVVTILYFAWARIRKLPLRYKQGKAVIHKKKERKEGGAS